MKKLDYEIISSGSQGNCVRIENVMIDIGVKYADIQPVLYDVDFLLITHEHGDHVKPATLRRMRKLHPEIKVIANYAVAQRYPDEIDIICNADFPIKVKGLKATPFKCIHDVLCYGYTLEIKGKQVIYATDTETLEFAPDRKYDYLFLEANYDQVKLDAMIEKGVKLGYDYHLGAMRHLSVQKSKTFYFMNRNGKESQYIQLHKSKRFY